MKKVISFFLTSHSLLRSIVSRKSDTGLEGNSICFHKLDASAHEDSSIINIDINITDYITSRAINVK